ncbi:MAG: 50S ribosomal protein L10 [bacterium]|nr:50S ribosomal protein L10 [bacterium]
MAISKARKDELVAQLTDLLENSDGFVVVESSGMSVKQVQDLRRKVRGAEGRYVVVKNTLFTKALEQKGWVVPEKLLNGQVGVVFGLRNFPAVAKVVLDYTADAALEEKMKVKGGAMPQDIFDAAGVDTVSKLPSLAELRSQLAGLIVQPATGLVSVLNAATGQIVNVINAYVQDRGGGDSGTQSGEGEAA